MNSEETPENERGKGAGSPEPQDEQRRQKPPAEQQRQDRPDAQDGSGRTDEGRPQARPGRPRQPLPEARPVSGSHPAPGARPVPDPEERQARDTERWVCEPGRPEPRAAAEAQPGPEPSKSGPRTGACGSSGDLDGDGGDGMTGRQRLLAGLWPPRVTRAQLIVAVLLFVLGLGLAIQVSSTSDNSALRGARQEDLVRILDELDDRTERLEAEKRRLEEQRTELENSSDQAEEARRQTQQKEQQLGVLAGTVAAQGPGITMTVSAPQGAVEADALLDAVQELRAAGAEAIQINDLRVVADTYFEQRDESVRIDGKRVEQPFRLKAIGDPQDLEPALNIPGGVVQTLEKEQATVAITRADKIVVDALRRAERPDYARSSSQ